MGGEMGTNRWDTSCYEPCTVPRHQFNCNTLGALFYLALKQCNIVKPIRQLIIKLRKDTILQPDISILCQPASKKFIDFSPALVVEILSRQLH
jgi:Uma2 family endonuclease